MTYHHILHENVTIYADDISLDCSAPFLVEAETNLQKLVDNVTNWISTNHLTVNTNKSKTMLIGTRQNVTNRSLSIYIHNSTRANNSFKLLSVIFDSNLSLSNCGSTNIDKVQKMQNRASRIFSNNFKRNIPSSVSLNKFDWMTVLNRPDYLLSVLMYKLLNNLRYAQLPHQIFSGKIFVSTIC